MRPLRWLGRNLSTLLLAFVLAVAVWVSAVVAADPNQEAAYSRLIPIDVRGQNPALLIVNDIPTQSRLTINAPRSIWLRLESNPSLVETWIDLTGLETGEHTVEVKANVALDPARVVQVVPEEIDLVLEPLASKVADVQPVVTGDPALGYRKEAAVSTPSQVTISGAQSLVARVREVRAVMDAAGVSQTVKKNVSLQALDENGTPLDGLNISPQEVLVTQPISLLGGYRNVVVKVVTTGQVAEGYWLTNISVTPPNVTVFSTNPQLVNDLPGFVETRPLDLSGVSDDIDIRAELDLPEGVSLVGEQSVLVRVGVAALEGSLTMALVPEINGLPPELAADIAPETVDVILAGPLPVLSNLTPAAVRIRLDLSGLEPGVYPLTPEIDLLPDQVRVLSITPENVEVSIRVAPTVTPTPRTAPTPLPSPAPTVTPTP